MPEEKQDSLAVSTPVIPTKVTAQSNQLTRLAAFTPVNLTEAVALAKLIASSELAPKDYRGKPGNVLIAMQLGAELGVAPMSSIQNIAVINGRPSVWGDMMLALVQAHPDYEDHREFMQGAGDTRTAVFQIKRKGQGWHEQKFTVTDAKTAGLWGKVGPWKTNPDRMLQMRARGFGLRDKFADALKGLRLAEESMDLPPDTGKPTRETGTLEIAGITQSPEPNRGHGNEGMATAPAVTQAPGMDQTSKKADDTICGDCRQMNGQHAADCIHAVPANGKCPDCNAIGGHLPKCPRKQATTAPVAQSEPKTAQTGTQTVEAPEKPVNEKAVVKVVKISERSKDSAGQKQKYLVLDVATNDGEWQLYVWHKSLFDQAVTLGSKMVLVEYSKKESKGRMYCSLEAIVEVQGESQPEPTEDF